MNSDYITDSYKYTPLTRRLSCLAWPGLMLSLTGLQNFVVHVNADIRLGFAGRFIMGPAHRRLHHSTRLEEAQNYGTTIALWDHVFGTFVSAHDRAPQTVGVADPDSFLADRHWLASQLHPFTRAKGFAQPIEQAETGA